MKKAGICIVICMMLLVLSGCDALIELPDELEAEKGQTASIEETVFEGPTEKAKAPQGEDGACPGPGIPVRLYYPV